MSEVDIYKRSVNLYKITDSEYKDIYVEMYLYMIKHFTNLNMYESEEYENSIFFGKKENKCIFEYDSVNNSIWFDEEVYHNFETVFKIDFSKASSILQEFFMNSLDIEMIKTVSYPMLSPKSKYLREIT